MTFRRAAATWSGFIIGFWPAGLLVGGLDFYRIRGVLPFALATGYAATAETDRSRWMSGLAAGLAAAFGFHLLIVGAEWRFIGFAFERALPFIGSALAGAFTRFVLEHLRSRARLNHQS
jgi:hypothetical protein